jgi:hypothetical protein
MRQGPPSEGRSIKAEEISDAASAQSNSWCWCWARSFHLALHDVVHHAGARRSISGNMTFESDLLEKNEHVVSTVHNSKYYFFCQIEIAIACIFFSDHNYVLANYNPLVNIAH